ncbi:MAG: hypothetical protein IT519_00470 [Burkholderiales bacterium]|jgi:hypothetical protein|nr:hypothetical protein [Burkholderiales bacterium]
MSRHRGESLLRHFRALTLFVAAASLAACVAYVPVEGQPVVSGFDRSFQAASGAMLDAGLTITRQDRGTGTVVGSRGATDVVAQVRQDAGGTVSVEFTTRRANNEDPGLISRVTAAYQQRMGR